jgi:hypothetical protein
MTRVSVSLFAVFVTVVALGVPAQGAAAAPTPPQDFVVGGGDASGSFLTFAIDARSDPLGGTPSGVVSGTLFVGPAPGSFAFSVSCLAVHGNRAVIGAGPLWLVVVDNGPAGSPPDAFVGSLGPTDCSSEPPGQFGGSLLSGDIVVRDAPSKAQCRDGGWRNYTDATGQPFTTQGECIAFALGVA